MKKEFLVCMMVTILSLLHASARSLAQTNEEIFEVKGRIVLFDWRRHGSKDTFEEDFVVRLSVSKKGLPNYVRVVYPGVAYLAPEELKAKYKLAQHLFVGRGDLWTFRLRRPQTGTLEQSFCNRSHQPFDVTDELGSVKLPAHFPTPGALGEKVPALASLPCFIMTEHPGSEKTSSREKSSESRKGRVLANGQQRKATLRAITCGRSSLRKNGTNPRPPRINPLTRNPARC